VLEAALEAKVERFVLVSTDKAVRPTNVMGASKRVAEIIVQLKHKETSLKLKEAGPVHEASSTAPASSTTSNISALSAASGTSATSITSALSAASGTSATSTTMTKIIAVRFGNVIGSAGSVIPLFKWQIAHGGPVTVTHPEVTRYFMTISEAVQLILQAGAIGESGDIYILKMGRPVKIVDMARDLIRLSGLEPDKDIGIHITGLRPGEKLYEELITEGEGIVPTSHDKLMVLRSNGEGNGSSSRNLEEKIDELLALAKRHDSRGIQLKLCEIVPEYKPQLQRENTHFRFERIVDLEDEDERPGKDEGEKQLFKDKDTTWAGNV
ncbi:MAG: polysaccharide biosynthesis protein, partial [bacterium]